MKIQIKIGELVLADYVLARTTAPESYDGFGTFTVNETYLGDRKARLILINDRHLDWQIQRNLSGLHPTEIEETAECFSSSDV